MEDFGENEGWTKVFLKGVLLVLNFTLEVVVYTYFVIDFALFFSRLEMIR